jgi:hypothetical protein
MVPTRRKHAQRGEQGVGDDLAGLDVARDDGGGIAQRQQRTLRMTIPADAYRR